MLSVDLGNIWTSILAKIRPKDLPMEGEADIVWASKQLPQAEAKITIESSKSG
jgi:hypothetical protein